MNWFSRAMVGHYPHSLKHKEVQKWGGCDHVRQDPSLLYVIHYENDSFGQDGSCLCEECHLAAQRDSDQQEVSCADCHKVFANKDLLGWVPYDYYPREGDQPIYVCGHCQTQPTHQQRVLQNTQRQLEDDSW